MRNSNLDPVIRGDGQKLVDVSLRRHWSLRGARLDGMTDLHEHLFQAGWRDSNDHPRGFVTLIF